MQAGMRPRTLKTQGGIKRRDDATTVVVLHCRVIVHEHQMHMVGHMHTFMRIYGVHTVF